ncbi:MAG TPA: hypothetical protein DCR74_00520 [Achromobacter sp.]|nr:hypothetical protein [Achromobacter sp.]
MKHPILYLCATAMSGLLATSASAQRIEKTLVAQAQTTTPDSRASSPSHPDRKAGTPKAPAREKSMSQQPKQGEKGDHGKRDASRAGSSPRQDDAGTDTRGAKGTPGSNTGSTGHGGMPGSGASSGSGGTADPRGQ